MTEITEILGMQRSMLGELRRTREAVERIERLLARASEGPSLAEPSRPGRGAYMVSARGMRPDELWACGNSMHLHGSKEEAEACPDYKKRTDHLALSL